MTTTLRAALRALLAADTALAALATNGVKDLDTLGRAGLELADLNGGTAAIKPTVFIRWSTAAPYSDSVLNARSLFVELYFYADQGYTTIESMRARVFALLHQKRVSFDSPTNEHLCAFRWAGDVLQQVDDQLGGAAFERSRYEGHLVIRG
jgi:hypothetical protein